MVDDTSFSSATPQMVVKPSETRRWVDVADEPEDDKDLPELLTEPTSSSTLDLETLAIVNSKLVNSELEDPDDSRIEAIRRTVAQLESIVASAAHKPPDPIMCFDLLSDLIYAIEDEPKVLGARRPVRHLASVAMAKTILKGDAISIYSRVSSLQVFLADGKKNEAQKVVGAAQCLAELYRYFGRRIISGMLETTHIVAKLLKFTEFEDDYVK